MAPARSSRSTTDTVIVGGGFTGVTAARELTMRGRGAREIDDRLRLAHD
jgi:glycine/D-amino acid oxidase-like deaminating enzyme